MKKHIVYVVNVDWFFKSHRLPLALEALRRDYRVSLITENTGLFNELSALGLRCYHLQFGRGYSNPIHEIIIAFKLYNYYKKLSPDIIHHVTLKPYLYGSLAARANDKKHLIINAVTGLGSVFANDKKKSIGFLIKQTIKLLFNNKEKTKFIFQNEDDLNFFKKIIKIENNEYSIIKGSGVDEKVFSKSNNESNKITVTFVGRILQDKGVFEFIHAAKILKSKLFGKCEFLLVGSIDSLNPSSIKESTLINLLEENYITWLGHRTDIKEIYNNTDIACLPSYREGLPKSLVEAMAMSCPIITTDAPGCRDCVDDGHNGFLVPIKDYEILADRILTLVNDEQLRLTMGKASREKMVEEMSLDKIIEQTFSLYEQTRLDP